VSFLCETIPYASAHIYPVSLARISLHLPVNKESKAIDINKSERNPQPLTTDPVYYAMVAVFAILTTGLPASLGQVRFLPIVQAIALTVFLAIPLSAGLWQRAVIVMATWMTLALVTIAGITSLLPEFVERSFAGGFQLRTDITAWVYGAEALPGALGADPSARAIELAGIVLGSLASGGLAGNWMLMRAVNLAGFEIGVAASIIGGPIGLLLAIPVWSLARVAGMAGFVILFSQPLLTGEWSPRRYWDRQRRLIIWSLLLTVLGLVLGFVVPNLWQSLIEMFVV
jgi:hypothetical protein